MASDTEHLSIRFGDTEHIFLLERRRAPEAVSELLRTLPLDVVFAHGQWSGAMFGTSQPVLAGDVTGSMDSYQVPGGLYADARSGKLYICYGPGRLQDGTAIRGAVPLGELVTDVAALARAGDRMQFEGSTAGHVRIADEFRAPEDEPLGYRFGVEVGEATALAVLREDLPEAVVDVWANMLPMSGQATNTHSSGPLLRFWNARGGDQGETALDVPEELLVPLEVALRPGVLYYLPTPGYRGIRMPFESPTAMRSAIVGGGGRLMPLARLIGDWSDLRQVVSTMTMTGAKAMRMVHL